MFFDLTDDQIVALILALIAPALAWVGQAARRWLSVRAIDLAGRVLEGAVHRAISHALADESGAVASLTPTQRARVATKAEAYISAASPGLLKLVGGTSDQMRLRLQAEVADRQMRAREYASPPHPG